MKCTTTEMCHILCLRFPQQVEDDGLSPITPLIKEEVKMKIKLRRMAEGKEDIRVEFKDPEPEQVN
jgi:hypothetical protein